MSEVIPVRDGRQSKTGESRKYGTPPDYSGIIIVSTGLILQFAPWLFGKLPGDINYESQKIPVFSFLLPR